MDYSDLLKFTYYNNLYNVFNKTVNTAERFGMFAATSLIGTIPPPMTLYDLYTKDHNSIKYNSGRNNTVGGGREQLVNLFTSQTTIHTSVVKDYSNKNVFDDKKYALIHFTFYSTEATSPMELSFGFTNSGPLNWNNGTSYGIVDDNMNVHYCPAAPNEGFHQETIWLMNNQYKVIPELIYASDQPPYLTEQFNTETWPFKYNNTYSDFYLFANINKKEIYFACFNTEEQIYHTSPMIKPTIELGEFTTIVFGGCTETTSNFNRGAAYSEAIEEKTANKDFLEKWMKSIIV